MKLPNLATAIPLLLAFAAGVLSTEIWRMLFSGPAPRLTAERSAEAPPPASSPQTGVRVVYPQPGGAGAPGPTASTAPPLVRPQVPQAKLEAPAAPTPNSGELPARTDALPAPKTATPAEDMSAATGTSVRRAVDLNTASLEELDSLEGGGKIGRAIISARPYASPDDLVRKRVLTRADFDRIKDQVTVE